MSKALGFVVLILSLPPLAHAQGEVIDRVMAVVAGEIITQSDVDAALAIGLVDAAGAKDRRSAALQLLIERQLKLREVRRFAPTEPSGLAVDQRLQAIRQRFASPAELSGVLARWGMDDARLREMARDDLAIQAYVDGRFATVPQPTEEELASYYKAHLGDFTQAGRVLPLPEVRERVQERVAAERRKAMIADWVAGLRRRTEVTELYLPSPTK